MKLLFTIFLIFSALFAKAQVVDDSLIVPFEDYRQCRTGFTNGFGDTVWQAVFDDMFKARFFEDSWAAKKDGKYGILGLKGEVIYPFQLDTLFILRDDLWTIEENGKQGLFSAREGILVPMIYSSIKKEWKSRKKLYSITLDDKVGYLDSNYSVFIPPIYTDLIIFNRSHSYNQWHYADGFISRIDSLYGLIDKNGSESLTPMYKFIDFISFNLQPTDTSYLFRVGNFKNEEAVINTVFDTVVPFFYSLSIYNHKSAFNFDDGSVEKIDVMIYASDPDSAIVYNAEKGTHSKPYYFVGKFDGFSLFQDNRGWGVLDEDFNEVFSGGEGVPSVYQDRICCLKDEDLIMDETNFDIDYWRGNRRNRPKFKPKDQLLFYGEREFTELEDMVLWQYNYKKKGLINFISGAKTPSIYHQIFVHKYKDQSFYWGLDTAALRLDIYNEQMKLITKINTNERVNLYESHISNSEDGVLIFQNENDLYGAVEVDGSVIIPFEFDNIDVFEYAKKVEGEQEPNVKLLVTYKDNKRNLFTREGKILFAEAKDNIENYTEGYYTRSNNRFTVYDKDWNIVDDEISGIYYKYYLDSNGFGVQDVIESKKDLIYTYYYIKDSLLYITFDGNVELLDHNRIPFEGGVRTVHHNFLLRQDGKVLSQNAQDVLKRPNLYVLSTPYSLEYYDLDGNLVNRIDSIRSRLDVNGYKVLHLQGEMGIIDRFTGKWAIAPGAYESAFPINNNGDFKGHFWVPSDSISKKWNLVNSNGKQLSTLEFDYPKSESFRGVIVTESNGKFGAIAKDGKILLPFEYDCIYHKNKFIIMQKDGLWGAMSLEGTIDSLENTFLLKCQYEEFALSKAYKDVNHIIFFNGDEISAYDQQMNPIFSGLSAKKMLEQKMDFELKINSYNEEKTSSRQLTPFQLASKNLVYGKNLLRSSWSDFPCETHWIGEAYLEMGTKYLEMNDFEVINFLVERNFELFETTKQFICLQQDTDSSYFDRNQKHEKSTVYLHYYFNGVEFEGFEVENLFKEPRIYDRIMDKLILDQIQIKQSFGLVCLDTPTLIEKLKKQTIITKNGLEFYGLHQDGGSIVVPYEKLTDYIKPLYKRSFTSI